MKNGIKSKDRVQKYGEVYTPPEIVSDMCDLVGAEVSRIDSRVLEPACGNGNFLAEILRRKLDSVAKASTESDGYKWRALVALASLYGVDILPDNVRECRERLHGIWIEEYTKAVGQVPEKAMKVAQTLLNLNIICANTLTGNAVDDETGDETFTPFAVYEWEPASYGTNPPGALWGRKWRYIDLTDDKAVPVGGCWLYF